jgi:hypothetical protein
MESEVSDEDPSDGELDSEPSQPCQKSVDGEPELAEGAPLMKPSRVDGAAPKATAGEPEVQSLEAMESEVSDEDPSPSDQSDGELLADFLGYDGE